MNKIYLIDTNIIIDYLRNKAEAVRFLEKITGTLIISSLIVAELYAGIRNIQEQAFLEEFLRAFKIISVDNKIAQHGGLLKNKYGKSHGTGLADALIAATAENYQATLVTLNKKHFPMIKKLMIPY